MTNDLVLVLVRGGNLEQSLYVDAGYASKAIRGAWFQTWQQRWGVKTSATGTTQHCEIISTSAGGYVAMPPGGKGALFARAVLECLQPTLAGWVIDLYEDNHGAIALAKKSHYCRQDKAHRR